MSSLWLPLPSSTVQTKSPTGREQVTDAPDQHGCKGKIGWHGQPACRQHDTTFLHAMGRSNLLIEFAGVIDQPAPHRAFHETSQQIDRRGDKPWLSFTRR